MQALEKNYYSPHEYLELEVVSDIRNEYINGEIVPMTGGLPNHNQIAGNLYAALHFALKRQPYRVFITDQRLWIPDRNIYTYPDVMVVADPLILQEGRRDTIVNPLLIAEVLSKSTRNYDSDEKFSAYRTISSFREYLLLDQDKMQVKHYAKSDNAGSNRDRWIFTEYTEPTEIIPLASLPLEILLTDLYDKVDFEVSASFETITKPA
jgi:Uma2 family endonuclease